MRFLTLSLVAIMSLGGFASDDIVDIEAYGQNGERAATFLGQPMPESFYKSSQIKAIAAGVNYTAMFDLQNLAADQESLVRKGANLILSNWDEDHINVVVSAVTESENLVSNYLIGLNAEEVIVLDVSDLDAFTSLYVISAHNFEATLDMIDAEGIAESTNLDVNQPDLIKKMSKNTKYCTNLLIQKKITNDTNGSYVYGWFKRNGPWTVGSRQHYSLEVHYPYYGTVFHDDGGGSAFSSDPACKMWRYSTWQVSTNKHLRWENKYNYWNGFDEVLYNGATGKASCTANCAGDTTTWTISN